MGTLPLASARILAASLSTHTTSLPLSAKHTPATRPTYPVPTTAILMSLRQRAPRRLRLVRQTLSYRLKMRVLVDYRPALRARTGVGEYMHELVRAYTATHPADQVAVFTSSWADRPAPDTGVTLGARVVDRRVPVSVLNYLWHRAEWPPVEWLAGDTDVV